MRAIGGIVCCIALVLCVSTSALAGANPEAKVYIDFDPPFGPLEVYPEPGELVQGWVILDCTGGTPVSWGGGMMEICLRLSLTPGMAIDYEFFKWDFLWEAGEWEEGICLWDYYQCRYPDGTWSHGIIRLAYFLLIYSGVPIQACPAM
jgi:hypothetical protein